MKKILAIAVASAIAAPAMADMTIGGTIVAGYSANSDTIAATYTTSATTGAVTTVAADKGDAGFGIDTAALSISGSETTEGGLTFAGYMSVGGLQRAGSIGGENAGLAVSGDFGKFSIDSSKAGNGVMAQAAVGGAEDFSAELASEGTVDRIYYTAPAYNGVTFKVGFTEALGVGTGQDSNLNMDYNLSYAAGALSLAGKYVDYASEDATNNALLRVVGSYDLGSAVVAAGWENADLDAANADVTRIALGIKVPMGATTLGAGYGKTTANSVSRDGWSVAATQALSANVSVKASYAAWDSSASSEEENKSSVLATLKF